MSEKSKFVVVVQDNLFVWEKEDGVFLSASNIVVPLNPNDSLWLHYELYREGSLLDISSVYLGCNSMFGHEMVFTGFKKIPRKVPAGSAYCLSADDLQQSDELHIQGDYEKDRLWQHATTGR